jgi:hypothetical protein
MKSQGQARLKNVNPNALTPIEALQLICDLQGLLKG